MTLTQSRFITVRLSFYFTTGILPRHAAPPGFRVSKAHAGVPAFRRPRQVLEYPYWLECCCPGMRVFDWNIKKCVLGLSLRTVQFSTEISLRAEYFVLGHPNRRNIVDWNSPLLAEDFGLECPPNQICTGISLLDWMFCTGISFSD